MSESDGVSEVVLDEGLQGQLRLLVTAAGQVGEQIARDREETARRAQAASEQEARRLRSRIEAERRTARAEWTQVHRDEWWEQATPQQIGDVYQSARAWRDEDAVRAQQRIENELRSRYGLSFSPLSGLADDVTRADAAQQRHRAVAER
ncbi:MAG: hypothetical protein ACRC35_14640, partial [Angustibacter sp.]